MATSQAHLRLAYLLCPVNPKVHSLRCDANTSGPRLKCKLLLSLCCLSMSGGADLSRFWVCLGIESEYADMLGELGLLYSREDGKLHICKEYCDVAGTFDKVSFLLLFGFAVGAL